ncbi:hypothetical protein, partial [Paraburkholderia atlantica]|uniref:hypothetical protein n=1 Tax=Paraburkholderia atlantica TaxID=2654982 RepID=UPI001C855832
DERKLPALNFIDPTGNRALRGKNGVSTHSGPVRDNDLSTKRPLDSATFTTQSRSSSAPKKNRKHPVANWAWRKPRHPG